MKAALVAWLLLLVSRAAAAYPQFQLAKDQTCTGCHISPAGGLLLNENGKSVAQNMATYDVDPEALHGLLGEPSWLQLGGDVRAGAGLVVDRGAHPAAFPMQADIDAAAHGHGLTFLASVGAVRSNTFIASHEHWLMWKPDDSSADGLYLRVGRFMPVFGLRLAEHTAYTRRYGQTPLYGETYGAAAEIVEPGWELHVTGFVHDPIQEAIETGNGGAVYGELRPTAASSIGAEARYAKGDEDSRIAGGLTGKYWIASADVLLEGEVQWIRQKFSVAGGSRDQLVSYLLGSWFVKDAWMLDIGVGQFDEDLHVKNLDLECIDANLHWFATSHWELLMTNRIQTIALGAGGATSAFALLQFHYRL